LGEVAGDKIIKVMDFALSTKVPIIGILDSGGARIQEGVVALGKYGEIFKRNTQASGVIPQISIVCGPAAGGAVYSPALTDFVIMVDKTSQMFVTGPDVIKAVTGEDVGMEELGGARTHNTVSGVAHYLASDEDDAFDYARVLLSYLPDNCESAIPVYGAEIELEITDRDRRLNSVIPDSPSVPYDVLSIIEGVVDPGSFLEVQPLFAPNIVVGFGRVEGRSVGVIASQPNKMAGTLNIDAGEKAARFVRFCDAFGIPIITLVDVPGYLPGTDQEWTGVIRRGANLGIGAAVRQHIRIGVGAMPPGWVKADWVLSRFAEDELDAVRAGTAEAADAAECVVREGLPAAMNRFNKRVPQENPQSNKTGPDAQSA
jgi:propionyl-CoA carboxylase beta chain